MHALTTLQLLVALLAGIVHRLEAQEHGHACIKGSTS
jgi:hypothetical protein